MSNKLYTLGIDLHKFVSTWVLMDQDGTVIRVFKRILVRPLDITTAIEKLLVNPTDIQVGIEPACGWRWVSKLLEDKGIEVHIANPLKHKSISQSDSKNDLNDAEELAHLLRVNRFHESYRVSDEIYELRNFLRQRQFLVEQRTRAKLRLHGYVTATGLHNIKGHSPLTKEGKELLLNGDDVLPKDMSDYIDHMDKRIARYDKELNVLTKTFNDSKYLLSMPGCGNVTAMTVIAEVGDFSRFKTAESLARFSGLLPREHSSGGKTKNGSLMRSGDRVLRSAMVELSMRIHQTNAPELYAFVGRLSERMPKKKARTALAHKLLGIMWKLVKDETYYDANIIANITHTTRSEQYSWGS